MPQAKRALGNKQVIFQCDGVNDVLVLDAQEQGLNAVPLFDKSGGAGILPGDWPLALFNIACGYAGGLGPENVQRQLHNIKQASRSQPFWIDMERRVRSADDAVLDLAACERVLELCSSEFSPPLE